MARQRRSSGFTMGTAEERENLTTTVLMLNDASDAIRDWGDKNYSADDAVRLRRMVLAWRKSRHGVWGMDLGPKDRSDLERFAKRLQVHFKRDGTLSLMDCFSRDPAALQFTRLLRNSQRDLLGGPCLNDKCGRWYIKKSLRQRDFCSRTCAGNAVKARARAREHKKKLERARKAIRDYPTRASCWHHLYLKDYAVEAKYGVSKKFITVEEKRGNLTLPARWPKP